MPTAEVDIWKRLRKGLGRLPDLDKIDDKMRRDKGYGEKKNKKNKKRPLLRSKSIEENYTSEGETSSQSTPRPTWTLIATEVAVHPFVKDMLQRMATLKSQIAVTANATVNVVLQIVTEEEATVVDKPLSTIRDEVQYTVPESLKCIAKY